MANKKLEKVYFYSSVLPAPYNTGASVRVFSNIRDYLDLNYDIEVFLFTKIKNPEIPKELKVKDISFNIINTDIIHLDTKEKSKPLFLIERLLNRYFPIRQIIKYHLMKNLDKSDYGIHHFEYLSTASAFVGLDGFFIWSNHDIVSERYLLLQKFRREIGQGKNYPSKIFKYFVLRYIERLVADSCRLMLTLSKYDHKYYQKKFKSNKVKLLPFSTSKENHYINKSRKIRDGRINLLHLGSTNSVLTYSSLKFILKVLFIKLPPKILNTIQLTIVGNNPNSFYSNQIKKYALSYKQVTFEGFKENIEPYFESNDLQIVATQHATGIRTKIIESFAHGLPIISSEIGARGLYGLKNKENILLCKNENDFAEILNDILHNAIDLDLISANARKLYEKEYSKLIHKSKLEEFLNKKFN